MRLTAGHGEYFGADVELTGVPDPWSDVDLSRADLDIQEAAIKHYAAMAEAMNRPKRRSYHGKPGSGRPVTSRTRAHYGDLGHDEGDWSGLPLMDLRCPLPAPSAACRPSAGCRRRLRLVSRQR